MTICLINFKDNNFDISCIISECTITLSEDIITYKE